MSQTKKAVLYLMIGFHRTGSTYLQTSLFTQQDSNLSCHLVPPSISVMSNEDLAHALIGVRFPWSNPSLGSPDEVLQYYKMCLAIAGRRSLEDGLPVIIASEEFCRLDSFFGAIQIRRFIDLFQTFDVRCLAFIREQESYIRSRYQQECFHDPSLSSREPYSSYKEKEWESSYFFRRLRCWHYLISQGNLFVLEYNREVNPLDAVESITGTLIKDRTVGPVMNLRQAINSYRV